MTATAVPEAAPAPALEGAPIERLGGRTALENCFVRVDIDDVRFPDGAPGTYNTVTVGAGKGVVAVPVLPFRGSPYLGFVRQYRYPVKQFTLELPRGGSDDLSIGEAARELVEETGLAVGSSQLLGILRPDTGILTTEVAVWFVRAPRAEHLPTHHEAETGAALQWYGMGDVTGLIRSGAITCGITLAALAMLGASGALHRPY
jgi:ADP-ribose pyrophosphatase